MMNITKEHNRDRRLDKNLQDDWLPDQERRPGATSSEIPEYGGDFKSKETIPGVNMVNEKLITNVMDHDPMCCITSTRIAEIKYLLSKYNLEEMVVLDEEMHPVGLVGPSDVENSEIQHKQMPSDVSAMECMRKIPAVLLNNSSLEESLNVMRLNHVESLPVVDMYGHLEGILKKERIREILM